MSKARELSSLTSDGSPLADGAINASEVSGLSIVATSGSYNDLSNIPAPFDPGTLATVATTGAYSDLSGTPALAAVATTGAYSSLSGLPTIPTHTSQLTNNSGFLTSAPAPSTAQVLSATAGASAGAVGTYAWLAYNYEGPNPGLPVTRNFGSTQAGSNLIASGAVSSSYSSGTLSVPSSISMSVQSGTWRAMGATHSNYNGDDGHTVWLRIA